MNDDDPTSADLAVANALTDAGLDNPTSDNLRAVLAHTTDPALRFALGRRIAAVRDDENARLNALAMIEDAALRFGSERTRTRILDARWTGRY